MKSLNTINKENSNYLSHSYTLYNLPIKTFLDTGADNNYLNQSLINKLNIKTKTIQPITIQFANKNKTITNKIAKIKIKLNSILHTTSIITTFVIQLEHYFILGSQFLD
ncbi:hypothetical protein DMUE_2684 [Dictyocoela muelleri]|nr:hypothetical protein DMUE_2684 [Dictyocoela muelleri]